MKKKRVHNDLKPVLKVNRIFKSMVVREERKKNNNNNNKGSFIFYAEVCTINVRVSQNKMKLKLFLCGWEREKGKGGF